jgi:molybdate transport system substrate-binding protein
MFSNTINIAVAANVSYAIDDLVKEFNKIYPNTKVIVTLGSSGKLTAQIRHNAPYGLFMSANMKYPNYLYDNKIAITKPVIYAKGSLALLSIKKYDLSKGLNILKDKKISKIAIANPKTAPYGIVTKEALQNAKLYDSIKKKFIFGESISSTVSYTITATDIGIIAKSSLYSSKMSKYKKNINWVDIDPKLYTPTNQGIVLIKNTKNKDEVKNFYDFILSKKSHKIFKNYGYILP